jgi:hypothetical protein
MIFNAILGLYGIAIIIVGILISLKNTKRRLSAVPRNLISGPDGLAVLISLIAIGAYITAIFILGTCSKNRRRVLIAYFVLKNTLFFHSYKYNISPLMCQFVFPLNL